MTTTGQYEQIRIRRFGPSDDFSAFDCGDKDLNGFIRDDATRLEANNVSRVYVATTDARPIGYVALLTDTVVLKTREKKKLALNHDDARNIPAVKVGRLAIDKAWGHRRGVGTRLVALAYMRGIEAARALGCRLLTVDAYSSSEAFYRKLGFIHNKEEAAEQEECGLCFAALPKCQACGGNPSMDVPRTVSMRFDLKAEQLPAWLL